MYKTEGWMWGVIGAVAGTLVGLAGASIAALNTRRTARGEENFLKMRRWNVHDSFYTSVVVTGLLFLIGSLLSIWYEAQIDAYALSLLSLVFLSTGCLNAILRIRTLQA